VTTAPPDLDRRTVEATLEDELTHARGRRLLLVYGRYTDRVTEFTLSRPERRRVRVSDEHSVLGIVEAWQQHLAAHPDDDDLLVVTTSVEDSQLGWDVLAYAIKRSVRPVDRGQILARRFGATDVDSRIRTESWLVDALLAAEPAQGWPRNGAVLTRDAAVRALIGARLNQASPADGGLDAAALLHWSLDPAGPARFADLPQAERDGLTEWLADAVGDFARVVLRLAAGGRGADAVPLGLVGAEVARPDVSADVAMAFGALLGGGTAAQLQAFSAAAASTVWRSVARAHAGDQVGEATRARVLDVVRRADELAAQAELTGAMTASPFLPSAFTSRSRALAATLTSGRSDHSAMQAALDALGAHCLSQLEPHRLRAAEMAVRLVRWLAAPTEPLDSVADGTRRHLSQWAWVDRALTTLWEGDATTDQETARAYRTVCEAVRSRRSALDEAFAGRLRSWARHASTTEPGGALLIEQVLDKVALPLVSATAPLIIVLDGMSGAVAVDLGEQLAARSWTEVSPTPDRRVAAVSAIPSVTQASRPSLLTGALTSGDQATERKGFTAFWRRHRRTAALFHKNDIPGEAGQRLSEPLMAALSGEEVVGVVLNTIDYALDHGREGDRSGWLLRDISFLPELLNAARDYGRPVVLVSDHGHVLHRCGDTPAAAAAGAQSARWRTGTPDAGEVALTGPRVLLGDGSVVVPWQEDIRYLPRRAGYHGGAALAEMTVPVLVLLPSAAALPAGWAVLGARQLAPPWWDRAEPGPVAVPTPKVTRSKKAKEPEDSVPLFAMEDRPAPPSLGARVVATEVYAGQRSFVPKAPDPATVAAVIDALVGGDGSLPLGAVATVAGRAPRGLEFFAATLQRLLNVDGYSVLSLVDGDRRLKLDQEILRQQFGVRDR